MKNFFGKPLSPLVSAPYPTADVSPIIYKYRLFFWTSSPSPTPPISQSEPLLAGWLICYQYWKGEEGCLILRQHPLTTKAVLGRQIKQQFEADLDLWQRWWLNFTEWHPKHRQFLWCLNKNNEHYFSVQQSVLYSLYFIYHNTYMWGDYVLTLTIKFLIFLNMSKSKYFHNFFISLNIGRYPRIRSGQ